MSIDEHLRLLDCGTIQERRTALRRIGFRLAVCNRNRDRSLEAWQEAIDITAKVLKPISIILTSGSYEDRALRAIAVEVLGESYLPNTVPILFSATRDSDHQVAQEAYIALFRLASVMPGIKIHEAIRNAYLRQSPDSSFAAVLENCLGDYSNAQWLFWRLFTRSFEKSYQFSVAADLRAGQKDFLGAIPDYWAAIRHWPYDCVVWQCLGACLVETGHKEEGLSLLKFGLFLSPFEPQSLARLADGLRKTGDFENAAYFYSQVIELEPGPDALIHAYWGRDETADQIRTIESARPLTDTTYETAVSDIAAGIQNQSLIIFCGAGISFNSGLPLVEMFVRAILRELNVKEREVSYLIDNGKLKLPFESFMGILQENSSIEPLLDIFGKGEPNSNHCFIANLMVSGRVKTVVTTNFDTLIEQALHKCDWRKGEDYNVYSNADDFSKIDWSSERPKLIKIHGSVGSEDDRKLMAVTMREVAGNIHTEPRKNVIDQIFGSGNHQSILIMGYSSSDSFDITPYIQAIDTNHKQIFLIEHGQEDKRKVEDIRRQRENNPFLRFGDSYRVFCPTDNLVQQLKAQTSVQYQDVATKTDNELWMSAIYQWHSELIQKSEVSKHIILGRLFGDVTAIEAAADQFRLAVGASQKEGDKKKEAFARALLGDSTASIEQLETALAIARQISDKIQEANCLASLAKEFGGRGQFENVINYANMGLAVARSVQDRNREGRLLGNLGAAYGSLNEFNQAFQTCEQALAISHEVGDKAEEGRTLLNIAKLHHEQRRGKEAYAYYRQSIITLRTFLGRHHPLIKLVEDFLNQL